MQDATSSPHHLGSVRHAAEALRQVTFRLTPGLIRRLDDYARQLTTTTPGLSFTRVDAVRFLLERALAQEGLGRVGDADEVLATRHGPHRPG